LGEAYWVLTVDTDTQLRGRLVAAGRVVVNLWFDGDIVCSHLTIGSSGYLTGSAAAHDMIIEGQVSGPIHASSVVLKGGCIVEGDIHHTTIIIEPGATMTGRASRFPVIQLPAELLQLEAQAADERSAIEDAVERSFAPDPTPAHAPQSVIRPIPGLPGVAWPTAAEMEPAVSLSPSNILPLRRSP
jgi:Polymer-forming cytoskeletal